nr:LEA_3 domain-containing protein [Betula platyphylla]UVJ47649.1 LEA-3 domain-containing protein [Betula platyphylla]
MARSLSNAKLLSALVADGFSTAINRRGYAAASQGMVASLARGSSGSRMVKKSGEEAVGSTEKVAWVPDPVTGYYRPENRVDEIDVAELRAVLLNNKH